MKSRFAVGRKVHHGLVWLFAAASTVRLRAHHIDFITVTADFRPDRSAWLVTVSMEALRLLEETQSTALAAALQRSDGARDAVAGDVFLAASQFLSGRLHFSTGAPREALQTDYQFSLVSVPDAASGRSDLFVVGRHEGELPSGARGIEVELSGSLRAIVIRKVNGTVTGPALTVPSLAGERTVIAIPPLPPVAARLPEAGGDSVNASVVMAVAAAIVTAAGAAIMVRRARRR